MKTTGITLAGLLATAGIGLAACSSSTNGKSDGPAPASGGTNAPGAGSNGGPNGGSASGTNSGSAPKGGGKDMPTTKACDLVSVDQVKAIVGYAVTAKSESDLGSTPNACTWDATDDSHNQVMLGYGPYKSSPDVQQTLGALRSHVKAVDIGLPAYPLPKEETGEDGDEVLVDGGSWFLDVTTNDDNVKADKLIPIAKAALGG